MTIVQKHLVFIPLFCIAFIVVFGGCVMLLWNWLMPELLGLPAISFWQATGLLLLCKILFGGFGGGHHHGHGCHSGIGGHSLSGYIYTLLYLVWLGALWLHLNHGIWSAMQTMGMSNKTWFPRIKHISTIYTTIIITMFALVAVLFCAGYTPSDINLCI